MLAARSTRRSAPVSAHRQVRPSPRLRTVAPPPRIVVAQRRVQHAPVSHRFVAQHSYNRTVWTNTSTETASIVSAIPRLALFSAASYASSSKEVTPSGPKPHWSIRVWRAIVEFVVHFKDGSVQLGRNVHQSWALSAKTLSGQTLSRRERQLLVRTTADMFRLVPFLIIVVVPFAEFALPLILKLFPNILPSTFTTKSQEEANNYRKLNAKLEVIKFLQETQDHINEELILHTTFDSEEEKLGFQKFLEKVQNGWKFSEDELIKYSKISANYFGLDHLNQNQLKAMCKFFGLPTFGTDFVLRETLRRKIKSIYADDLIIKSEGVDALTNSELEEACRERGIQLDKHEIKRDKLIGLLTDWIALTSQKVPMYLQILLRAYSYHQEAVVKEAVAEPPEPAVEPLAAPAPQAAPTPATAPADAKPTQTTATPASPAPQVAPVAPTAAPVAPTATARAPEASARPTVASNAQPIAHPKPVTDKKEATSVSK